MVGMSKAKAENRPLPKRFYAAAEVQQTQGGFCITLDGKMVKTPAKKMLQVSSQPLAEKIVAEWNAQEGVIDPDTMPLTRLAHVTLDRMEKDRTALIEQICAYGETDLICYRAPGDPVIAAEAGPVAKRREAIPESELFEPIHLLPTPRVAQVDSSLRWNDAMHGESLRDRQDAAFDPIIVWLRATCQLEVDVTEGVMPIGQSAASLHRLQQIFGAANDSELAALSMLVPLLGSAFLTLAVWKHFLTIEAALVAVRLDEDFQAEQWGADPHAAAAWDAKCRDARAAAFFLTGK